MRILELTALSVLYIAGEVHAFSSFSTPLLQQKRLPSAALQFQTALAKLSTARVSLRNGRAGGLQQVVAGVNAVVEYKSGRRPEGAAADSTKCACGSGIVYAKCCEEWHDRGEAPDPLALVKSRYSAYAYCLPEYIMATTQKKGPEWNDNAKEWEKDLLEFCNDYEFVHSRKKLGLLIEDCVFQGTGRATVLFKAMMLNKNDSQKTVELYEKSTVVMNGSIWLYQKGSLEEYSGPIA